MALKQEEQQALIDEILKRLDGNIATAILDIEKLTEEILLRNGFNQTTALNFSELFNEALVDSGYYETINEFIDDDFDELFKLIRQGINEGGFDVSYNQDDLAKFTALKNLQLEQFTSLGVDAGRSLQQNLYKYVLSDFSLRDVRNQLLEDFKGTNLARYSTTLARTAIGDFQQSVIDVKAEGLDGVWLYVGVNDSETRDYCKCVLKQNHYYTTEQKNRIMNNKLREYNCRHRARIVSVEYAESKGFTPTKRLVCGT